MGAAFMQLHGLLRNWFGRRVRGGAAGWVPAGAGLGAPGAG
jgi:hypothetical protein